MMRGGDRRRKIWGLGVTLQQQQHFVVGTDVDDCCAAVPCCGSCQPPPIHSPFSLSVLVHRFQEK